jgi:HlyD family secretion protein
MGRRNWIWLGGLLVAVAAGAAYVYAGQAEPPPKYRLAKIERGPITSTITATGTVNPVISVIVGSQLSGQIVELKADFNTQVKANQELARLDTELIEARLLSARADLMSAEAAVEMQKAQIEKAEADIDNLRAQLATAESDAVRREALARTGSGSASDAEKARNTAVATRAQLRSAEATLKLTQAQLQNSQATVAQRSAAVKQVEVDLKRSVIRSPIDGVVVQRNVDVGQTVAASLQAPTLFTIAQDLRQMEVHATIDEADIGRVRNGLEVTFTVNAYPNDRFVGRVAQVRLAPTNVQNVITYTVVIAADNAQLKLLPGMTATVTVVAERREDVMKVANAALRYRPPGRPSAVSAPAGEGAAPSAGGEPGAGGGGNRQAQAEALKRSLVEGLKLDKAQVEELDRIFAQSASEMRAVALGGATGDERRTKFRQIREAAAERINAMLNDAQKRTYADMRAAQAGGTPGELHVVGADGQPKTIRVRIGVTDGTNSEIMTRELKAGDEVIVGGGPRAAAPQGGLPRLGL